MGTLFDGSSGSSGLGSLLSGLTGGAGNALGALTGFGGTGTGTDGLATGGDQAFSQVFDPTGSTTAMDAITGNQSGIGPTGTEDLGGQQSSTPAGTQTGPDPTPQPQAPQAPQQAPTPVPPSVAAMDTSKGPFSPAQQPNVAGPSGWTAQQVPVQTAQQAPVQTAPAGGVQLPDWAQTSAQDVAGNKMQVPSYTGNVPGWPNYGQRADPSAGTPPDTSTDPSASQDAAPSPGPAQTSPPAQGRAATTLPSSTRQTGAAGQGGFPGAGGTGNIISDILGIMSGNPQSLMKLVQDMTGMGGVPGMPGMGGQQGGQGAPWLAQGQAAPPGTNPMNFPPAPPGMRFVPGQGLVDAQGNRVGASGQPGAPGQIPPRPRPPGQAPGTTAPTRVTTQPVDASGQPSGGLEAGTRRPLGGGAAAVAPSRQPDGTMPTGRTAVTPIVTDTLRASGARNNAIQGILFNVGAESDFNPSNVAIADQANHPEFRGTEANNAHGLYQEGGDEWNNYARWLNGRDWRDPQLQTQFLAANLKQNYPQLWQAMNNARTPEDAAKLFARDYLRPSPENLMARYNRINKGGVQRYSVPEASRASLLQPLPRLAGPAQLLAAEAYAQRQARQFNTAYPGWRQSPNVEDRRGEPVGADLARSWRPTQDPMEGLPKQMPDPNNPLARALGVNDILRLAGGGPRV
jgi:hypothetical protein